MQECIQQFGFRAPRGPMLRGEAIFARETGGYHSKQLLSNERRTRRTHLKMRILGAGLLARECQECGLTEWRGKSLSLELDHINGNARDNRLENLRLLCPNCHSQTPNYAGRNKGNSKPTSVPHPLLRATATPDI